MNIFSDRSVQIAQFKKEFETLRKNMDTGGIISAVEGVSEVRADVKAVKETIANVERKGEGLHLVIQLDLLPLLYHISQLAV